MNEFQCVECAECVFADEQPPYCPKCGSDELAQICPMCGCVIDDDTKVCPSCKEAVA